jgi:MoaA/NifB/PqqE/SkfB family radical SAM enzyme
MNRCALEDIGFYTLSDKRALESSVSSPLWRCELILTDRCNFKCPYCRGLRDDICGVMPMERATHILDLWIKEGLRNVRFSGGEPLLYAGLGELVDRAKRGGVRRIAISTNGSASLTAYYDLVSRGVNDLSISLDGCCASTTDRMTGTCGYWDRIVTNIIALSKITYVTVGMVFTDENVEDCIEAVKFAASLGVSDIRVIPSAQYNEALLKLSALPDAFLARYPILAYRVRNIRAGRHVRGIPDGCENKCCLVLDDMAVAGKYHFPCIIYMREGGDPIGEVSENMRVDRERWMVGHDPSSDPICKRNCIDVCIAHNSVAARRLSRTQGGML